jgi:hypothetical protein
MPGEGMKVIFLDIDGVLHIKPSEGNSDRNGGLFKQEAVEALREIITKFSSNIVVSSNWKLQGIEYLRHVWEARNMPGKIIGITPVIDGEHNRYIEIQKYIDENGITDFIVIDDSTGEGLEVFGDRFINTDPTIGLTKELLNEQTV